MNLTFYYATLYETKANIKFANYFLQKVEDDPSKMRDVLGYLRKAELQLEFSLKDKNFK